MQKVNPEPEQAPDCQVDDRGHKSVNGAALSLELTPSPVGENERVPRYSKPGPQLVTYYFQLIIGYLLLERRTLIVQCLW